MASGARCMSSGRHAAGVSLYQLYQRPPPPDDRNTKPSTHRMSPMTSRIHRMCNPDESNPPPPRSSSSKTNTISAATTLSSPPLRFGRQDQAAKSASANKTAEWARIPGSNRVAVSWVNIVETSLPRAHTPSTSLPVHSAAATSPESAMSASSPYGFIVTRRRFFAPASREATVRSGTPNACAIARFV